MNYKLVWLQGVLYAIIGAATPLAGVLSTDTPITNRTIAAMIVAGIIGGATAAKAFLSDTFANRNKPQ